MADVTSLLHSARRAVEAGDHKAALPLLDEAVKLGPNLFGVHMLRGICLSAMNRPAEGVKALQRAIELNATSAQGHYNLGVALLAAGRSKEAEQHFRQALRLQPGYEAAAEALRPAASAAHPQSNAQISRPANTVSRPPDPPRPRPAKPRPKPAPRPRPATEPSATHRWRWARWVVAIAGVAALAAVAALWLPRRTPGQSFIAWQAPGSFSALDFSPDGGLLAVAGEKVKLWRVGTGVPYRDFGWGEEAVDVAFSPSGNALAVSSRDEKTGDAVKLWRMPDSGLVGVFPQTAGNRPLAFSPDGKLLAIGTDYMSTASPLGVQLWAMPERTVVGAVASPEVASSGYVTALAFSRDGKLLASADDSGTIWISNVADRKRRSTIQTENMVTVALAFSPSGKTLAYGGSSGPSVTVCTVPGGKQVEVLKGDSGARGKLGLPIAVKALAFSPDGRLVATCESTGDLARIELFRVSDGELLKTVDSARLLDSSTTSGRAEPRPRLLDLRDLQFSPDGRYLAWCGSQGVVVARVSELRG